MDIGDRVQILRYTGKGGRGTVVRIGVEVPKIVSLDPMIEVERDDGTGTGLYTKADLRLVVNRDPRGRKGKAYR